jgi:hypothetical protein|tara:strand:+ start:184 stop:465 length:282 start_codon:yes stop_codon:yes gene_type:complete
MHTKNAHTRPVVLLMPLATMKRGTENVTLAIKDTLPIERHLIGRKRNTQLKEITICRSHPKLSLTLAPEKITLRAYFRTCGAYKAAQWRTMEF